VSRDHRVERSDWGALALQLSLQVAIDPDRCLIEGKNREWSENQFTSELGGVETLAQIQRSGLLDLAAVLERYRLRENWEQFHGQLNGRWKVRLTEVSGGQDGRKQRGRVLRATGVPTWWCS